MGRRGNGEGPAGATVPYDVRGLHAARGANWTRRAEIFAKNSKNKPAPPRPKKKIGNGPLAHWEAVKDAP